MVAACNVTTFFNKGAFEGKITSPQSANKGKDIDDLTTKDEGRLPSSGNYSSGLMVLIATHVTSSHSSQQSSLHSIAQSLLCVAYTFSVLHHAYQFYARKSQT